MLRQIEKSGREVTTRIVLILLLDDEQEAQLSLRDCATLRVIEYFAKSLKGHSK